MPDTIGFALATAFLASVFTVFGMIDRLVAGVAGEIRYSIAPAMVSGVQAWRSEHPVREPFPGAADDGDVTPGGETAPDRHDPGLVVPVTSVPHRAWHLFGRVMRLLVAARRRLLGVPLGA